MKAKAITVDCVSCSLLSADNKGHMTCNWGKTKKPKLLLPQKGKKPLSCQLIKNDERRSQKNNDS